MWLRLLDIRHRVLHPAHTSDLAHPVSVECSKRYLHVEEELSLGDQSVVPMLIFGLDPKVGYFTSKGRLQALAVRGAAQCIRRGFRCN
jgi:hypothetical protein